MADGFCHNTQPQRRRSLEKPMSFFRRLALFTLAFCSAPATARPVSELLPQFDQDVSTIFARYKVPAAAVAVVENGQIVYIKALGVTSTQNPQPVDTHTIFRLASVSKTFAAVLAGQAEQERRLSLNDPLNHYLPGFQLRHDPRGRLNLRHVLSHQGGLPHNAYDDLIEAGQTYQQVLPRLQSLGAVCQVGDCFSYQNVLYSTIGDALTKVTGQSYPDLLQQRLFTPLGMHDSGATLAHFQSRTNAALPHIMTGRGWWPKKVDQPYYEVIPAAGVNASINDMAKYLLAVMGHRPEVIPPTVMRELTRPLVSSPKEGQTSKWRQTRIKQPHYGLGWRVFNYNGSEPMVFHAGGLSGVRARIGWLPNKDVGIVMMWNANEQRPEVLLPMLFDRVLDLPEVDYLAVPKPALRPAAKKPMSRKAQRSRASFKKSQSSRTAVKKAATKKAASKKSSSKKATSASKKKPARRRSAPARER